MLHHLNEKNLSKYHFLDTDLANITPFRQVKLERVKEDFPNFADVKLLNFDITKDDLVQLVRDSGGKKALFIMEGVSYWIDFPLLQSLFSAIHRGQHSIIFDYWDQDCFQSQAFSKMIENFKDGIAENVKLVFTTDQLASISTGYSLVEDIRIDEIEERLVKEDRKLIDIDTFVPVRYRTLQS